MRFLVGTWLTLAPMWMFRWESDLDGSIAPGRSPEIFGPPPISLREPFFCLLTSLS